MTYQGLIHKYGHLLDLPLHSRTVSLLEGNTPLIKADRLSAQLGGDFELYIKLFESICIYIQLKNLFFI